MKTNDFICDKERTVENCYGCEYVKPNHEKRTFYCDAQTSEKYQAIPLNDHDAKRAMLISLKTGFVPFWAIDCLYSFFVKSGYDLGVISFFEVL